MENTKRSFWLPTIPTTLIDTVNRRAAATGSIGYAMATENADYNGHHVSVSFNDYRGYWVAEYFWGGRIVIARGELARCLQAAKEEYARGAKGCTVRVHTETEEQAQQAIAAGFQPWSEEIEKAQHASYTDPRCAELASAMDYEKWGIFPSAVAVLVNSKTVEEYHAKFEAFKIERKAQQERAKFDNLARALASSGPGYPGEQ